MPFPTLYSCTSVIIIIAYVYLKHVINVPSTNVARERKCKL